MVINGSGKPRLVVIDATHGVHNPIATINLPYCEKLTETFDPVQTRHNVQSGLLTDGKGWNYSAKLDYSGYLDGAALLPMSPAFEIVATATQTKKGLILIPRVDAADRQFNVIFDKSFDMSLIYGQGHADIVFEFLGTDLEPNVPMMIYGYGAQYAGFYADLTPSAGWGYSM